MACKSCTNECLCAIVAADSSITVTGSGSGSDPFRISANLFGTLCVAIAALPDDDRVMIPDDRVVVHNDAMNACELVVLPTWEGVGAGLLTITPGGDFGTTPVISVTCEDVQDCVAPMMANNGFTYDDTSGRWVAGGTVGQILTSNGDGTASFAALACEAVQDCVGNMLVSQGMTYDDGNGDFTNAGASGQVLTSDGAGNATWETVVVPTCEAVQDCVGDMLDNQGFSYDDAAGEFTNPGTAGQTLTANGDGTASFQTPVFPDCEAVQDCVGPMLTGQGFIYDDATGVWTNVSPGGMALVSNGDGTASWGAVAGASVFLPLSTSFWPVTPWSPEAVFISDDGIYYNQDDLYSTPMVYTTGVACLGTSFINTGNNFFPSLTVVTDNGSVQSQAWITQVIAGGSLWVPNNNNGSCSPTLALLDLTDTGITVNVTGAATGTATNVGMDLDLAFNCPSGEYVEFVFPNIVPGSPMVNDVVGSFLALHVGTDLSYNDWFDTNLSLEFRAITPSGDVPLTINPNHPWIHSYDNGWCPSFTTTPFGVTTNYFTGMYTHGTASDITDYVVSLRVTAFGPSVSGTLRIVNGSYASWFDCPAVMSGGGAASILESDSDAALVTMTRLISD